MDKRFLSHPPMRPLPEASRRPMARGRAKFVDAQKGSDTAEGSEEAPWKTIGHALKNLGRVRTLYLRGGTYYENVVCSLKGRKRRPFTIRSYPGELAVIDGGYREFFEQPSTAWEPVPDGAGGEYRSVRTYPELAEEPGSRFPVFAGGAFARAVRVLGNFGDSMVPLHGYAMAADLRAASGYWRFKNKLSEDEGMYCGPGVWSNPDTQRIHIRLAHQDIPAFGEGNYKGETDPRKLPLVIGGAGVPLLIHQSKRVRIQDLVVRGTRSHTINLTASKSIEFDHVEAYGGCPAMYVRGTIGLRLLNCALRGVAAPWSSRSTIKYRGNAAYLFVAVGSTPQCQDFEMAYSEFTDCHDGLTIGTIDGLKFHHNLVDNFNDDGLYLTLWRDRPGENIHIYQSRISRCLSSLAFAQFGKGIKNEISKGVYICRNVFDLREPVHYGHPRDESFRYTSPGRVGADHGGPIWDPIFFYHNTIIGQSAVALNGLHDHTRGSRRRVFNNVIVQIEGLPGLRFPVADDIQSDGNLYWSASEGPAFEGDFFARFRASKQFEQSKEKYPPGFTTNDRFGAPVFVAFSDDWRERDDLRLKQGSPAIRAGIAVPEEWDDPLHPDGQEQPDIGALPHGTEAWKIGIDGRFTLFGGLARSEGR